MNHVLSQLEGLDYFLVKQALRRLANLQSLDDRRALLDRILATDGLRIRRLVEDAFREEWQAKQEQAA